MLFLRVALGAFVVGAAIACGSDAGSPTSTTVQRVEATAWRGGIGTRQDSLAQIFQPTPCATKQTFVVSGVFGPAGGTLVFGDSRLIIPGGALHDTVTLTATIPEGPSYTVQLEPHGLQFFKPAGLLLNTASCSTDVAVAPSVVYLGQAGEVLEFIAAYYDPHWQTIAAPLWHFSGYAVAF